MRTGITVRFKDLLKYERLGVQVELGYANKIKELICLKFGSFRNSYAAIGVSHAIISELGKRCVRVYTWEKIFESLSLNLNELERHVIRIADKETYEITFPYNVTPLLIRLAAHIIGDGGDYQNGARWIQLDVSPIISLQKQLLGVHGNKVRNDRGIEQVSIMTLYTKLACAALRIERKDLRSEKFIRACMRLLREYKVQVLAAIIEDEGSIKPKSGNIQIAMKDYEIMKAIGELIDDLGYERSNVIKIKNYGFKSEEECFLYSVNLRILGSHKLHSDIKSAISKYGELAGLWKKQKQLEELVWLNNGRKAKGAKINEVLSIKTINLMKENNNFITYKQLRQILGISHHRTGSIVKRLHNKRIISKKERGHYTLLNRSEQ